MVTCLPNGDECIFNFGGVSAWLATLFIVTVFVRVAAEQSDSILAVIVCRSGELIENLLFGRTLRFTVARRKAQS